MRLVLGFFSAVLILSFAELFLLVEVASRFGLGLTVLICIFTGILGGSLIRLQGLQTYRAIQADFSKGRMPATRIVSGMILLVLGAFLLTPGFVTDALGFIFLVPWLRTLAAKRLIAVVQPRLRVVPRDEDVIETTVIDD